jgi:hypothetical protein
MGCRQDHEHQGPDHAAAQRPREPGTEAEITRLQAELLVEGAKLKAAQEAHRQCLERFQVLDDTRASVAGCS